MMNKKILTLVILSALIGVFFGSIVSGKSASANIFDNFINLFKKNAPATSTPSKTSTPLYKPAIDYENAVIAAVEAANPSVVSIVISKDLPIIENCPTEPFSDLPPEFQKFFGQDFQFSEPCQKGTKLQEVGGG